MDEIRAFSRKKSNIPTASTVSLAYETTTPSSPMRALMRDLFAHRKTSLDGDARLYPAEFLQDLVNLLLDRYAPYESGKAASMLDPDNTTYNQKVSTE